MSKSKPANKSARIARHNDGPVTTVVDKLRAMNRIAFDYGRYASFDPEDERYSAAGRTAIKKLIECVGTPVFARYAGYDDAYVGRLTSDYRIIVVRDGQIVDDFDATPGKRVATDYETEDDVTILKSTRLTDVRRVTPDEAPELFDISNQPPYRALYPWPSQRDTLLDLLD